MVQSPWEVADVFQRYGEAYRREHGASLSLDQLRVMRAIEICRTAALGGHIDACSDCGEKLISYNSCRNRHCPKCQAGAKARWLEARWDELLPVEYFHVVFTVPEELSKVGLQNKRVFYNILFRATSKTLRTLAADPKHLGAEIGFLAVLHSWGQALGFHPHLHCIVPGGGFDAERRRWIACRPGFFLPVRVLSRYFRRCFLEALETAHRQGRLEFHGALTRLQELTSFRQWLALMWKSEWVVYAKPPFGGAEKVLDYLGRYTHRVAIANHRILDVADGKVTFLWRDYRHGKRQRRMTLDAGEFIRRFLLHVLPTGFVRIRYFGFLAHRYREERLGQARALLASGEPTSGDGAEPRISRESMCWNRDEASALCPACGRGRLVRVEMLPPAAPGRANDVEGLDSS